MKLAMPVLLALVMMTRFAWAWPVVSADIWTNEYGRWNAEHTSSQRAGWSLATRVTTGETVLLEAKIVTDDGLHLDVSFDRDGYHHVESGEAPLLVRLVGLTSSSSDGCMHFQVFRREDGLPLEAHLRHCVHRTDLSVPLHHSSGGRKPIPPYIDTVRTFALKDLALSDGAQAPADSSMDHESLRWSNGRYELRRWCTPDGGSCEEVGFVLIDRRSLTYWVPYFTRTGTVTDAVGRLFPGGLIAFYDKEHMEDCLPRTYSMTARGLEPLGIPREEIKRRGVRHHLKRDLGEQEAVQMKLLSLRFADGDHHNGMVLSVEFWLHAVGDFPEDHMPRWRVTFHIDDGTILCE